MKNSLIFGFILFFSVVASAECTGEMVCDPNGCRQVQVCSDPKPTPGECGYSLICDQTGCSNEWTCGAHLNNKLQSFLTSDETQSNPPAHNPPYPASWWATISKEGAPDWEIFPQDAKYGEVILSKRTELGIFSNFAATPFTFHGKNYASMEGFWQATKYPENKNDPRWTYPGVKWDFTRDQVAAMTAFDAKRAGDLASANMLKMKVDWVSFEGQRMVYKEPGDSDFYKLILQAMRAKLEQNPEVKRLLLQTDNLVLMPDHAPGAADLKAWQFFKIWMDFRSELRAEIR